MNWLVNLKLKYKLLFSFLTLSLFTGIVGIFSITEMNSSVSNTENLYYNMTSPLVDLQEVSVSFQRIRINLRDMIFASTPQEKKEYEKRINQLEEGIDEASQKFAATMLSEEIKNAYAKFDQTRQAYNPVRENLIEYANTDNIGMAMALLNGEALQKATEEAAAIDALIAVKVKHAEELFFSSEETASTNAAVLWSVILLALGFSIGVGLFITNLVLKPVRELSDKSEAIAAGELTSRVEYDSKDELGELAVSFNSMAASIKQSVEDLAEEKATVMQKIEDAVAATEEQRQYLDRSVTTILSAMEKFAGGDLTVEVAPEKTDDEIAKLFNGFNKAVSNIRDIIVQVANAVQATASASSEISSSSEELAAGAQEQSSQATEIAGAVEEMTATILENTKNATSAAEVSKNAGSIADNGAGVVNETISGMNTIAEVVSNAASRVKELGDSTDQIGQIIQVIDDIADQTNLLALNAAIEAARAGEEGRGFAVVADEVRKLAERTVKATKEIADKIKQIQEGTSGVVNSIEQGSQVAENGKLTAQKAGDALNQIINTSKEVVDAVSQVAAASEQQSATSEQIAKNIEAISSVTHESASGTEQIARAAEDLNRLTDNLQSMIEQFKVAEFEGSGHKMEHSNTLVGQNGSVMNVHHGGPNNGNGNGYH